MKNQNAQNGGGKSKPTNGQVEHGVLESTAQVIGSTLGTLAVKTGIAKASKSEQAASSTSANSKSSRASSEGNVVSMAGHKPGGKHVRRPRKKK